jgi:hypothetical protein
MAAAPIQTSGAWKLILTCIVLLIFAVWESLTNVAGLFVQALWSV